MFEAIARAENPFTVFLVNLKIKRSSVKGWPELAVLTKG